MEYEFTVKFRRNLSDDEPIARQAFPGTSLREALLQQLRRELQTAYDETNIAGSFNIIRRSYRRI
jgi:hypothetical protein